VYGKCKCIGVLAIFLLSLIAGTALANKADQSVDYKNITHKIIDAAEIPATHSGPSLGSTSFAPDPQPPGDTVGTSEYEYQNNGSAGRQIAYTPNLNGKEHVHFLWMKTPGSAGFRHIAYNSYNITDNVWIKGSGAGGGAEVSGNNGGYCSIDVTEFGSAVGAWHEGPASALYGSRSGMDATPPTGTFNVNVAPGPPNCGGVVTGSEEAASTYIWPHVAYQQVGSDMVVHVVSTESVPEAIAETEVWQSIIYYRYVNGTLDNPTCGVFLDSSTTVNAVAVTDPNSDKVALVWLAHIYPASNPCEDFIGFQNDVYYMESTNGGADWGPKVNVTDYSQGGTLDMDEIQHTAFNEVAGLYTEDGYLHLVWITPNHDPDDDPCQPLIASNMWHWSSQYAPGQNVSLVLDATNPQGYCSQGSGGNNGSIAKVSIAECDSMLYLVFSQAGVVTSGASGQNAGDCSETGYANFDLMMTASSDGGVTWGPDGTLPVFDTATTVGTGTPIKKGTVIDLSNTWTDGCIGGECHSELWPTVAAYSSDVVHIFYVDDNDAGGSVNEEGDVFPAAFKYTTYDCFSPEAIFDYAITPDEQFVAIAPESSTPDDSCTIEKTAEFELKISNAGNVPINYTVTSDQGWLTPASANGTITAGINTLATITYNVGPITNAGDYAATLSVALTSSEGGANIDVPVTVRVACKYFEAENALLSTSCWSVGVWNVPRSGLNALNTEGNMFWFLDSIAPMYDNGVVISDAADASETYFSLFDGSDFGNELIPLDSLITETFATYEYAHGAFATPDTMITGEIEYYLPTHPDTCVLIERIVICNSSDVTKTIHIGEGIDWDIPDGDDGSNNQSGKDESRKMVYQYGPIGTTEASYHGGAGFPHSIVGAKVLENDTWVYDHSGYVPTDIGNLLATHSGFEVSDPDSVEDLNCFYVVCQNVELDPGECVNFCKVKASSLSGLQILNSLIDGGFAWISGHGLECMGCAGVGCVPGDANGSGGVDIDDVVYLIGYIFSGGPAPVLNNCCGDANGSCGVDIDDVVYLIGYIFSGGPAPLASCDICGPF